MVFSSCALLFHLERLPSGLTSTVFAQGEGILSVCGARSPYVRDDEQEGGATTCSSEKAAVCKTCLEKTFSLAPVWPELKEASKRAHACAL